MRRIIIDLEALMQPALRSRLRQHHNTASENTGKLQPTIPYKRPSKNFMIMACRFIMITFMVDSSLFVCLQSMVERNE